MNDMLIYKLQILFAWARSHTPSRRRGLGFSHAGFTLIELTVVIAIIGILASMILVQFPGAIKMAKDSRVISDMSQFRTQTLILYASQESYDSVYCNVSDDICNCGNSTIEYLCNDIEQNTAQEDDLITYVQDDGEGFCAVAHLQGSGKYFCVDGELHAREYGGFPDSCSLSCEVLNDCRCE